jgi:hypothetical protein
MADPVYNFELREATIALLKQQGIHEGRWLLSFEFQFGAGMMGPGCRTSYYYRSALWCKLRGCNLSPKGCDSQCFAG